MFQREEKNKREKEEEDLIRFSPLRLCRDEYLNSVFLFSYGRE